MTTLSDEMLVALADGKLSVEEELAVERMLDACPSARRFMLMLRLSALAIRDTFPTSDFEPVPERLSRVIAPRRNWIETMTGRWAGCRPALPAAACVFLSNAGIAALASQSLEHVASEIPELAIGRLAQDSDLARTLDRFGTATYSPASAGSSGRFIVTATSRDKFGNTCHEVDVHETAENTALPDLVVACRQATGGWIVVGALVASSRVQPGYAADHGTAGEALRGVLAMIGARERTAAGGKENGQQ